MKIVNFLNASLCMLAVATTTNPVKATAQDANAKVEATAASTSVPNPWFWSDVPDPDIIRVGDYYYLVSTTMHLMPGAPIMRSTNLINWETVSYLFDEIHDTPRYDLSDPEGTGTVYGRGQWATSIRYHKAKTGPYANKGMFWALFSANDEPHKSMLFRTEDPAKGWTLHARLPHFHDCSLFFDDDDRIYVFSDSKVKVTELNETLTDVRKDGVNVTLNNRDLMPEGLLEGSRVIKHDGMYYLSMISWPRTGRQQLAFRSDKIEGPYEMNVILKSKFGGFNYAGQGTVVNGKKGEWYGVIFQDRNGVGRVLTLSPCQWIDGWPMIGDKNGQIPDEMVIKGDTSRVNVNPGKWPNYISIVKSDEFDESCTLPNNKCLIAEDGSEHPVSIWQWNHNPLNDSWSLSERPGYLRLKTNTPAKTLYHARNTITQRMEGPTCTGTVCMEINRMKDGDRAGFAAFNGHSAILTIEKNGSKTELVYTHEAVELTDREHAIKKVDREEKARINLKGAKKIYLRISGDFRPEAHDNATLEYSLDNKKWNKLTPDFGMKFDYRRLFMGTKFAIFNYCTKQKGGYVDVDWFHYEH